MNSDAKFEEKLIYCFKNGKNLVNFDLNTHNSRNFHFDWFLLCKVCNVWPKKYRGVVFHDNEEWCKIWRKTDLWFEKWHEEFGKFSPEHSKVSKFGLWCMSLKFTVELCVMTMKNDAKFEEELTCRFKIDMTNLTNFYPALKSLKNLHFNGLLLTKVLNIWAKRLQRSYVWWHWILMQNLKENWLCFQKWHEEFGKFSQAEK